ncbi:LytR/AlgR family response regulator transcription factor [Sunxiuqinia sp. A32]|uniref:LytR/AlgR family response regulator transcription factor n=1 Tax=Sunxiuqinia sp. A32 TaxID=3461496 RepID=UPI00404670D3
MKTYSCIIVDDEPLSREIIADYVSDCPELNLTGQFPNAFEAREFLQKESVELIFLDINMPRMSGVSFLKSLNQPPAVIFITAYPEYAVEGFDLEAVDYLLKPVSQERFMKAVNRFLEKQQATNSIDYLMVKADKKLHRIELDHLLYVEAMGDYIRLITTDKNLTVYERLSNFAEKLPADQFCRIHKSYLVSLSKIEYIEANQVKIGEVKLPVSATYREQLSKRLSR